MKKIFLVILALVVLISCNKSVKRKNIYPSNFGKIIEKHGGLDVWRSFKTVTFTVKNEEHTTELNSRKALVNTDKYSLGFDGENVWLKEQDSAAFKGTPEFYYNLYFYFYAMPFVLTDDGIIYSETKAIEFEGVSYPGIKISYKANVGTSPDDNYFIYYHPETYQMEWLGYTVTYFSKKPSSEFNIIRYNDWENINGLVLPKSINWYKKNEEGNPLEPNGEPTKFSSTLLSKTPLADSFFEKPKQ